MFTERELKDYKELQDKFYSKCERVAKILEDLLEYKGTDNEFIFYAKTFILDEDWVEWEYIGYSGIFPTEYLTMSDTQLERIVGDRNADWRRKQEERKKSEEQLSKEERRKQYEILKKEFEGDML